MNYNLKKGENYQIAKSITTCYIGLGWDVNQSYGFYAYDLDVVVLLTDNQNKLLPFPNGVVFYNNPTFPVCNWQNNGGRDESIIKKQVIWLSADNRDGIGDGDDEYLYLDLTKIPSEVSQIIIAVTIHEAGLRKQTFGQIQNAFVRIAQGENYPDLARYDINQTFTTETCLIFGRLYRQNSGWTFEAVGKANNFDLQQLIDTFSN